MLRSEHKEVIDDALEIIQRAAVAGTLDQELEFWGESQRS